MASSHTKIKPLSFETQSRIRSSVRLSTITDAIIGLVENSLDANAEHIYINVDFQKGYCSVLDDGCGIPRIELVQEGHLARIFSQGTSKDTNGNRFYGKHGRFLASLSAVSLLSITSRSTADTSPCSVLFTDGVRIATNQDTHDEELERAGHGTHVVVHNLFGQMPVRVKHRISHFENPLQQEKEFFAVKKILVGLLLAAERKFSLECRSGPLEYVHKPCALGGGKRTKSTVTVEDILSTLSQSGFFENTDVSTWRTITMDSKRVNIWAAISLSPVPSKHFQFLSVGRRPLPSEMSQPFLDTINDLFKASGFTTIEETGTDDRMPSRNVDYTKKSTNQWPVFCIRIELQDASSEEDISEKIQSVRTIQSIVHALRTVIIEFLRQNGFKSRKAHPVDDRKVQSRCGSVEVSRHVSGFDRWSRVKSARGNVGTVLHGLPFMRNTAEASGIRWSEQSMAAESGKSVDEREYQALSWVDPRTGAVLRINPRTGVVLPHRVSGIPRTSETIKRPQQVTELGNVLTSLKNHVPLDRMEKQIRRIGPEYDTSTETITTNLHREHVCNLLGGTPLRLSDSRSTETYYLDITKVNLQTAHVLGQVDKKFILTLLDLGHDQFALALIDQHAADERVKVEGLFQNLCSHRSASRLTPVNFRVGKQESQRLQTLKPYFTRWGIEYEVMLHQVSVLALPALIVERCRVEPDLIISLLRREIWQERPVVSSATTDHGTWLSAISTCPQGVIEMLISRACRSAIMFNDKLTLQQCQELVVDLSRCLFPFQCAHGRPTLTVLGQLENIETAETMPVKDITFGQGWNAWVSRRSNEHETMRLHI